MKKNPYGVKFVFKGVALQTGDHIRFTTFRIPYRIIDACFTDVDEDGNMNVFSTLLAPFQHDGKLKESEVGEIEVVNLAEFAFELQSRNNNLHYGEKAIVTVKDETVVCQLLGAFDGIVFGWCEVKNTCISGGSTFFAPREKLIE